MQLGCLSFYFGQMKTVRLAELQLLLSSGAGFGHEQ